METRGQYVTVTPRPEFAAPTGWRPWEERRRPQLLRLPTHTDARGSLTVADTGDVPFPLRRAFWVYQAGRRRGGHGHERCEQVLVAVSGSVRVRTRWAEGAASFALRRANVGLYLPAGVWVEYELEGPDAVLLVLCSHSYEPEDVCVSPSWT